MRYLINGIKPEKYTPNRANHFICVKGQTQGVRTLNTHKRMKNNEKTETKTKNAA